MKQEYYQLDETDRSIIQMLMGDDKNSLAVIAQKVGISTTGVHQRVKKLEQAGVIDSSVAILRPRAIGYKVTSFVGIYLDQPNEVKNVMDYLEGINEVVEAHYVTGNYTLFVKILCIDNDHLLLVLSEIQALKGVTRTESVISLGQPINRQLKINSNEEK